MPFLIAVSMTVEPTSPSALRAVPLESINVIFAIRECVESEVGRPGGRASRYFAVYSVWRQECECGLMRAQQLGDDQPGLIDGCAESIERCRHRSYVAAHRRQLHGLGLAGDAPGADAPGGAFQRMRESPDGAGRSVAHARKKHLGLPVEKLEHLAFEACFAERHAREMREIDGLIDWRQRWRGNPLGHSRRKLNHRCLLGALCPLYRSSLTAGRRKPGKWVVGITALGPAKHGHS